MNIAVIFAGGIGTRMNAKGVPKQFLKLNGKEILIYTLELFEKNENIDGIIVSCLKEKIEYLEKLVEKYQLKKIKAIVPGGISGQESIYNGLKKAQEISDKEKDIVLIHDGVRPLIENKTINDCIETIKKYGNAITVSPAIETIINTSQSEVKDILSRDNCFMARAPQGFYLKDILGCHEVAKKEKKEFIDSASLMANYNSKLHIVIGPSENIKITTPVDFYMFKAIKELHRDIEVIGL